MPSKAAFVIEAAKSRVLLASNRAHNRSSERLRGGKQSFFELPNPPPPTHSLFSPNLFLKLSPEGEQKRLPDAKNQ